MSNEAPLQLRGRSTESRISPAIQTGGGRDSSRHTQAISGLCGEFKHKIAAQSSLNTSNLSETAAGPSVSRWSSDRHRWGATYHLSTFSKVTGPTHNSWDYLAKKYAPTGTILKGAFCQNSTGATHSSNTDQTVIPTDKPTNSEFCRCRNWMSYTNNNHE